MHLHPDVLLTDDLCQPACAEHIQRCHDEGRPLILVQVQWEGDDIADDALLQVDFGVCGESMPAAVGDFVHELLADVADPYSIRRTHCGIIAPVEVFQARAVACRIAELLELSAVVENHHPVPDDDE